MNQRFKKQQEVTQYNIQKYSNGAEKINAARTQIEVLSKKLDYACWSSVEIKRIEVKKHSEIAEVEAKEAAEINRIAQDKFAVAQSISIDNDSTSFEAICFIFGRQPKKIETGVPGVKKDDYWPEILDLLNDS